MSGWLPAWLLGLILLLPSGVCLGQSAPAAAAKPVLFDFKSYDLGKIIWYASADLPPDSSMDVIRERGTPTTPTVTLRSAVQGGAGMLFCFVQLPDSLPANCAGRLTIGDIDGNDQAFWNGQPIGSTSGWGIAEVRPRMYTVDHSLLKPGVNIFSLRLSGPGGRTTFGIRSKTITFCLTPSPRLEEVGGLDDEVAEGFADRSAHATPVAPGALTIDEAQARTVILAADDAASASLLQRKKPSFGRFGEFQHNGLPAVSEVTPTRVATRQGPAFEVVLDRVGNVEVARSEMEPGIDGWHRLSRVRGNSRGTTVSYLLRQNVLYPGAVLRLETGKVLELRVRFPEKQGQVLPLTADELKEVFGGRLPPANLAIYGFMPEGGEGTPAILAVSGLSVNVTQASSHIDISMARKDEKADARAYIFYPVGLYRVNSTDGAVSLLDMARSVRPGENSVDLVRRWLRLGLYEPVGVDEYFMPIQDDAKVRVYQTMRYRPATGVDLGGPLLMRPPQLDFARQLLGYNIEGPATSSTGVLAFSGDMHYSLSLTGSETTAGRTQTQLPPEQRIHLISYDLPVPPVKERAAVQMFDQEMLTGLINQFALTDLGSSASVTAVDALYKSRSAAYQAFSYLKSQKREELASNSLSTIRAALGGHFWNHDVEPDSGLDYWYTSFLQGPYYKKYDQDWGNGLSLYGLMTYVKYTGDWELPSKNWDAVDRIFRWFTVTDDWEWMRASNSAHGYGTGAGDCQNATYAAAVAFTKLAEGAGRMEDYHYGLYTLARTALPGLNRFAYGDFAESNGFKGEDSLVLGFHEGEGFLEGELNGYPWNATSNIAANGVQSETFDMFMHAAPDALRNYEQIFEKSFTQWVNGDFRYGGKTLYAGNSGMITLPHIYLRARLGGDSFATLKDYVESARSNREFWWISPPVISEILTKRGDGVVVTDWGRAAYRGGKLEETDNDDRRKLTLWLDNGSTGTNTVKIKFPRKPWRFEINGGPVPLTDSQYVDGELNLKLRRPGENVISVIYDRK